MVRHTLKILRHLSDHFTTLRSKGLGLNVFLIFHFKYVVRQVWRKVVLEHVFCIDRLKTDINLLHNPIN